MTKFEFNNREYEFDETLWELVPTPEKYSEGTDCPNTLRYIGPITNGKIEGSVPKFSFLAGTFADLTNLVELPDGFPKVNAFDCFVGCNNLNPSKGALEKYWDQLGSGRYAKYPLANTGSPFIVDAKATGTGYALIAQLFNADESAVKKKISQKLNSNECELLESETNLYTLLNGMSGSMSLNTILTIFDLLDDGTIDKIVFSTGATIIFKSVSKSSEIMKQVAAATTQHAFASSWSPLRVMSGVSYCYRLQQDFTIDSDDAALTSVFGRPLYDVVMNVPYIAGENATIGVKGNSTIKTKDACPLQASGTLTIKGSGTLTVECEDILQACIGTNTHTGMSYGRWEPGRDKPLEKIVVDGVNVICRSAVPNFSTGSYGKAEVPVIECSNGGSIKCPESAGKRIMIKSGAEGISASTKRDAPAVYAIELVSGGPRKINF